MNRNALSPIPGQPDDVDRTLAAYFRAQLPQPWPPPPHSRAEPARRFVNQRHPGRLTLALSLAGLLGMGWALSYGTNSPSSSGQPPFLLQSSTADGKELQKRLPPEPRPKLPMP